MKINRKSTRRTNVDKIKEALTKKMSGLDSNRRGLTAKEIDKIAGKSIMSAPRKVVGKKGGVRSNLPSQTKRSGSNKALIGLPAFNRPALNIHPVPDWFTNDQEVDVSIIVPLFKSAAVIKDQIASWDLEDDGLTKEVIYVDDCCPMSSKIAVVEAWTSRQHELKGPVGKVIAHVTNGGFGSACNTGANYARGKILIFLNADCTVTKNWVRPMVDLLNSDPEIGMVGNMQVRGQQKDIIDSAGSEWNWKDGSFMHIGKHIHNGHRLSEAYRLDTCPQELLEPAEREMVTGCCFAIDRRLFVDLEGFDTERYRIGYWEDADLCMRLKADGYKIYYQPKSKIWHKVGHSGGGAFVKHNAENFKKRWIDTGRIDPFVKDKRSLPPSADIKKHTRGKVVGCVIACNEQEFLEVSVDSIASMVDDWIFVIGGNEYAHKAGMCDGKGYPLDNTLEIAHSLTKKYGGKVIEPPGRLWKNKVEMRNSYASRLQAGNWMFMLDGDEVYKPNQLWRVAELMQQYDCLIMQFWCFWNDMWTIGTGKWDAYPQERLVRWDHGYHYGGKNHLNVAMADGKLVAHNKRTWRSQERLFYHYSWVRPLEKIRQKQEYYKYQTGRWNDTYVDDVFLRYRDDPGSVQGKTHPYGGGGAAPFLGVHPKGVQKLIDQNKFHFVERRTPSESLPISATDTSMTVCAIPKRWTGEQEVIQTNAVRSWIKLGCDVILLGDDAGTAEAARSLGCKHIPNIQRNAQGTPFIDSALNAVRSACKSKYILYANADVILDGNFSGCIDACKHLGEFLLVGERHNAESTKLLDFGTDWRKHINIKGKPQGRRARDYFLFERNMFLNTPAFAVGRGRWDSWIVGEALATQVPVVDASDVITCVHQNHDFNHIPGAKIPRGGWASKGIENDQNVALIAKDHPSNSKLYTTARLAIEAGDIRLLEEVIYDE